MNILIVEDDCEYSNVLRETLLMWGHKVLTATNGEEAYDVIQRVPVDLVVSDINMPGCSGAQLHERLRTTEQFRTLPFVYMTGYPILRVVTPLNDDKCDFMINKVQFDGLLNIINEVCL